MMAEDYVVHNTIKLLEEEMSCSSSLTYQQFLDLKASQKQTNTEIDWGLKVV